jgi:hypothetical protein
MQRPHRIREKTIMIEAIKINIQLNDTSRPVKANRIHRKSENLICFFYALISTGRDFPQ